MIYCFNKINMQVVKNFSNSRIKEHFTIQTKDSKFYVYEHNILVTDEMESLKAAEAKITLILLERKQIKKDASLLVILSKRALSRNSDVQEWPIKNRTCKVCSNDFETPTKRGFFRKVFCSKKCCLEFHNNKRSIEKKEKVELKELKCIICGIIFRQTKSNHVCCTQKCSNTNSIQKKKNLNNGDNSFLTLLAN